jgi:hypothetical protein
MVSNPLLDLWPDITFCPKVVFWKLLLASVGRPLWREVGSVICHCQSVVIYQYLRQAFPSDTTDPSTFVHILDQNIIHCIWRRPQCNQHSKVIIIKWIFDTDSRNTLSIKKKKAIPVTCRGSLQSCEMLRIPHYLESRFTDAVRLSAVIAGRALHPEISSGTRYRLSKPQGHGASGRVRYIEKKSMTSPGLEPATRR